MLPQSDLFRKGSEAGTADITRRPKRKDCGMLNKIKIGPKLIGGFLIVALIAAIVGILGIINMRTIDNADTYLYEKMTVPLAKLCNANAFFQRGRINIRDMIRANDANKISEYASTVDKCNESPDKLMVEYKASLVSEEDKQLYEDFIAKNKDFDAFLPAFKSLSAKNSDAEAYALLDGDAFRAAREAQAALDKIVALNEKAAKETSDKNTATANSSSTVMIITLIIGVLLAIIIGVALTMSLTKPLSRAVEMIQELGKGHLGMRLKIDSQDEIGIMAQTMDKFADDLQTTVVGTMQKIADGDTTMEVSVRDNQDEIAPALKKTVDALRGLITETKMLAQESINGNLSKRGRPEAFKGAYREIIEGLNQTLDAILTPINEAAAVLEKVAERDMTIRVKGDYKGDHAKIKVALNTTVDNLDTALQQVAQGTEQVSSAGQQISAGSQSLAQGANEQASSLEEVSSSLEEMSSMTKQNAENANQAKGLAGEANNNAAQGKRAMSRMSESINKIKESSDQTAKIVKTIDEIAMQTNLLALNAAVEAARAGEAGRGFAVVAEEVRNLAQRSAEAAKNTANMIEESVKNAEEGVAIAGEVAKSFEAIAGSNAKVDSLIAEIAAASQEQSQGIDQVNTAVAQMDKVTQTNAANSEESASAAEELSSQAEELQNMVAQFTLTNAGQGNAAKLVTHHAPVVVHQERQTVDHKTELRRKPDNGRSVKTTKSAAHHVSKEADPRQAIPFEGAEVLKEF